MAENSYPLVPSNYVTIHDLQERWMKRQREDQEKEQQPKHEPALSQSQRRNHVGRGEGSSSASAIVLSSNRPGSAMADSQAEKSRVWGVDEQSACVAVEEKGTRTASKGKRKKTKKKKLGVDGKGKTQLDEDANGGTEHMSAGKVAGESASSTDLLKDGTFKAEVKCVITESRAMQQSQPKIKSHNHARIWKVSGDSIPMERKIPEENQDGLDTVTHPQINIAYPANPTFKIEGEFKKLSMQGNRTGNRGRGGRWGGQSRDRVGDMVWVKKVEKVDGARS